jgi:hypothetical protein
MNLKKKLIVLAVLFVGIFSVFLSQVQQEKLSFLKSLPSFNKIALAGDDEGDDEGDNEGDDEDSSDSSGASATASKPQTYTQIIKLPDQIVTKTIMEDVVLPDTDKDGLADSSDPHPTIPEFIIVADANGNGIDDNYEIAIDDGDSNGVADNYENLN